MNIAIVFGGKSFEHDVSIVTAKQIFEVAKTRHNISLVYVDKNDEFFEYNTKEFVFSDFKNKTKKFEPIYFEHGALVKRKMFQIRQNIDCAVICCHGGSGENGAIENVLQIAKIPVTAGNAFSLSCAMNKWQTKNMLRANKIDVVDGVLVLEESGVLKSIDKVENHLDYPVIVKPCNGGSSIGIAVAHGREELQHALETGFCFDSKCVVEKAIEDFDEYNQAVLGDKSSKEISEIEKPKRADEILSFKDKYLSGRKAQKGMKGIKKESVTLNQNIQEKMSKISSKIFDVFDFFGVVRIDYIFDKQKKKLYVNEINAVPGSLAMYFFLKKRTAADFVDKLIEIGVENYKNSQKFNANFATNLF